MINYAHLAPLYAFALVVLCYVPTVRPLVVGRPLFSAERGNVECNMRRRYGYNIRSGRTATSATTVMMAKPSQPIPRNIKDTVSSLRAAVQVRVQFRGDPLSGVFENMTQRCWRLATRS